MRVLVTGASGFVGSHLVKALVTRGHDVQAVVRKTPVDLPVHDGAVTFLKADLARPEAMRVVEAVGADAAVHLAWYTEPGSYLHAVDENQACLDFSLKLLSALRESGYRRVVVGGTGLESVTGGAGTSIYATTKRALHTAAVETPDLSVACAHIHHLYGPGEDRRRVVPMAITGLLDNRSIKLTDGSRLRHSLHVTDVAVALCFILESTIEGGIDVVAGEPTSLREVLETVGELTGRPERLRFGERPAGPDDVDVVGDPAPLGALGFRPAFTMREGIADTVDWWRSHRD